MAKIFLINIGANSAHRSTARSPLFQDGRFVFVPFPLDESDLGTRAYPVSAWPFTNGLTWFQTHADPDWQNLTYGDYVLNPRASVLTKAQPSDILLFWALLWLNDGDNWTIFTNEQSWHLIGALRIEEILLAGQSHRDARRSNRNRAAANAHFYRDTLDKGQMVFVGDQESSALFEFAVPLVTKPFQSSLLYRTLRTANGKKVPSNGKNWASYIRSCRVICNLDNRDEWNRARKIRDAILKCKNRLDLLAGFQYPH